MSRTIDWTLRVRHRSYRSVMPHEIEEIESFIVDNLDLYDGELAPTDYHDEDLYANTFITDSYHAEQDVHEAILAASNRFPDFMFQTDAVFDDHEAIQINYREGMWDKSFGSITYEPHFNVKF